MHLFLEFSCSFLMAMSVVFIMIELKSNFDRSFLVFGITNLLLSVFCGIDIWLQPENQIYLWTNIQHIIASFFPAFILWYIMLLFRKNNIYPVKLLFGFGMFLAILFASGILIKSTGEGILTVPQYSFVFGGFIGISALVITALVVRWFIKGDRHIRIAALYHMVSCFVLVAGGILDIVCVIRGERLIPGITNYSLPGSLAFGVIMTFYFANSLSNIIRDREIFSVKLSDAYREMDEARTLKVLGQSTAIINHEIRNYTAVVTGYAELLLRKNSLGEQERKMVSAINDGLLKINEFSKEVLDLSKPQIIKNKVAVDMPGLVRKVIQSSYGTRTDSFIIGKSFEKPFFIMGDWNKLEHVFTNIFNNSFDAGAARITINSALTDIVAVITVSDNGTGCPDKDIQNVFKPFFTTKKHMNGTGIGLCLVRSIIEAHGGSINAYNSAGGSGFTMEITLPVYKDEIAKAKEQKDRIILISENLVNFDKVLGIFSNVGVKPRIVKSADEIKAQTRDSEQTSVLGAPQSVKNSGKSSGIGRNVYSLVSEQSGKLYVIDEKTPGHPEIFSESYVIEHLHG